MHFLLDTSSQCIYSAHFHSRRLSAGCHGDGQFRTGCRQWLQSLQERWYGDSPLRPGRTLHRGRGRCSSTTHCPCVSSTLSKPHRNSTASWPHEHCFPKQEGDLKRKMERKSCMNRLSRIQNEYFMTELTINLITNHNDILILRSGVR